MKYVDDDGTLAVDHKTRIEKTPIENHCVLNEAYDYSKKVSFTRGMRVELDNCVMLFISGTASVNEDGESVHPGDLKAQTRRMFNNIKGLLESEGADWHDVVRTTCYLADFRDYDEFNEVRNAFYVEEKLDPLPASFPRTVRHERIADPGEDHPAPARHPDPGGRGGDRDGLAACRRGSGGSEAAQLRPDAGHDHSFSPFPRTLPPVLPGADGVSRHRPG
jgi:enamine deaminase RidA (YjgF/YER057c/UK114 family)